MMFGLGDMGLTRSPCESRFVCSNPADINFYGVYTPKSFGGTLKSKSLVCKFSASLKNPKHEKYISE